MEDCIFCKIINNKAPSMKLYEDGIKYYKLCSSILDEAKQKIEMFEKEGQQ